MIKEDTFCDLQRYTVGVKGQLRNRKQLLDSLRQWHSKRDRELVQDWKDAMKEFLSELYSFQHVGASINQHYFDGHQALFPDLVKNLAHIIDGTEKLVGSYNDIFANGTEQRGRMDPDFTHACSTISSENLLACPHKVYHLLS